MTTDERNQLVLENEKLIWCVINRLPWHCYVDGCFTKWDAYQVGVIGLIKAVELYDENRGKFSTYAYSLIYQEIMKQAGKGLICLNQQQWGDTCKNQDFHCQSSHLIRLLKKARKPISFDGKWHWAMVGMLSKSLQYDAPPDADMEFQDTLFKLAVAINHLNARQAYIVRCVTGLNGARLSFAELGRRYGQTRENIRQLYERALQKLRILMESES